jgi:hypothetical protein
MLQVAAWLDEARSSRTDEQCMVTLGKRRRSYSEEMTPSQIVMLRSSLAGFYSDSDLLSAGDSRPRSIITPTRQEERREDGQVTRKVTRCYEHRPRQRSWRAWHTVVICI